MIAKAATVLIVRESPSLEVFMVRRASRSSFMPDAYVYPGGRFDIDDEDVVFENANDLHALEICAIRETFEESGFLLSRSNHPQKQTDSWRSDLNAGSVCFSSIVKTHGVEIDRDQMHFVSRWITPEAESKRFDTYFFLAHAPDDQTPSHDEAETTASVWISPGEALAQHRAGEFLLFPPTYRTLELLYEHETLDGVLSWAKAVEPVAILPYFLPDAETPTIVMAGDPDYPERAPYSDFERLGEGERRIVLQDGAWVTL